MPRYFFSNLGIHEKGMWNFEDDLNQNPILTVYTIQYAHAFVELRVITVTFYFLVDLRELLSIVSLVLGHCGDHAEPVK